MAVLKCFYCKCDIGDKSDMEIHEINNKNRKFHVSNECYKKLQEKKLQEEKEKEEKQIEYQKWCELYEYVKKDILGLEPKMILSSHIRNRLQGLRTGKIRVARNEKIEDNGYPYPIILMTFKLKKNDIIRGINGKSFNNENHKFDYIMAIISNSINDVYTRYLNKERQNKNLETLEIKIDNNEITYKPQNKISEDKVANLLEDLF